MALAGLRCKRPWQPVLCAAGSPERAHRRSDHLLEGPRGEKEVHHPSVLVELSLPAASHMSSQQMTTLKRAELPAEPPSQLAGLCAHETVLGSATRF